MSINHTIDSCENYEAELRQRRIRHIAAATLRGIEGGLTIADSYEEQQLAFAIEEARTQFQSRVRALLSDVGELRWLYVGDNQRFGLVAMFMTDEHPSRERDWDRAYAVTYQQQ